GHWAVPARSQRTVRTSRRTRAPAPGRDAETSHPYFSRKAATISGGNGVVRTRVVPSATRGWSPSSRARDTVGDLRMLRILTARSSLPIHQRPRWWTNHTGVTCGVPLAREVHSHTL